MRTKFRVGVAIAAPLLATVVGTTPASADIYVTPYPNAPETTCRATFEGGVAECTLPAIGRHFAVGISGFGVIRAVLEGPSVDLAAGTEETSACQIAGGAGCIGAGTYPSMPYAPGTTLTCRAYGVGDGVFECSNYDID